jgi:hypothetical protein
VDGGVFVLEPMQRQHVGRIYIYRILVSQEMSGIDVEVTKAH